MFVYVCRRLKKIYICIYFKYRLYIHILTVYFVYDFMFTAFLFILLFFVQSGRKPHPFGIY